MLMKPAKWAITPGLIDPKWRQIQSKTIMAAPCWEGSGPSLWAHGRRRTEGTFTDTGWGVNDLGIGVSGNGTATGDGIRIDIDFNDFFDTRVNGTTFSVVAVASSPAWTTGTYAFIGKRASSVGWRFAKVTNSLELILLGIDGYTSTATLVAPNGSTAVVGFTAITGTDVKFYEGGRQLGDPVAITSHGSLSVADFAIWSWWDGNQTRLENEWNGIGNAIYVFSPSLTAAEHALIAADPFGPITMVDEVGSVIVPAAAAAALAATPQLTLLGAGT